MKKKKIFTFPEEKKKKMMIAGRKCENASKLFYVFYAVAILVNVNLMYVILFSVEALKIIYLFFQ